MTLSATEQGHYWSQDASTSGSTLYGSLLRKLAHNILELNENLQVTLFNSPAQIIRLNFSTVSVPVPRLVFIKSQEIPTFPPPPILFSPKKGNDNHHTLTHEGSGRTGTTGLMTCCTLHPGLSAHHHAPARTWKRICIFLPGN